MTGTKPITQKPNFDIFLKSYKPLAVKHSIEKSIQLNFVNLSKTFCPRMSGEIHFYFKPRPNPLILHFQKVLVFQTTQSFYNIAQNICRLFHILAQLLFTTSETEVDFMTRNLMHELSHKQPNNLKLRILGNWEVRLCSSDKMSPISLLSVPNARSILHHGTMEANSQKNGT